MDNNKFSLLANQKGSAKILAAFEMPKTPKQVEKELQLSKLKIQPFLKNKFLETLNPGARKGRLYILSCSNSDSI